MQDVVKQRFLEKFKRIREKQRAEKEGRTIDGVSTRANKMRVFFTKDVPNSGSVLYCSTMSEEALIAGQKILRERGVHNLRKSDYIGYIRCVYYNTLGVVPQGVPAKQTAIFHNGVIDYVSKQLPEQFETFFDAVDYFFANKGKGIYSWFTAVTPTIGHVTNVKIFTSIWSSYYNEQKKEGWRKDGTTTGAGEFTF